MLMPILEVRFTRRRAGGKLGYVGYRPWMSPTCACPPRSLPIVPVSPVTAVHAARGCEAEAHDQLEGPTRAHSDIGAGGGTQIEDTQGYRRPQSTLKKYTVRQVSKPHVPFHLLLAGVCWESKEQGGMGVREWCGPGLCQTHCQRGASGHANLH